MDNDKMPENALKYECDNCHFGCSKYSNFIKHLGTLKHKTFQNGNQMVTNGNQKMPENAGCVCKCGNYYKHSSGLSRHKKKCIEHTNLDTDVQLNNITENQIISPDKDDLVMMILKQNADLIKEQSDIKHLMLEIIKNGTNNNNTINSHNKAFNLNFFLNETCKNAMNINEFVDSIKLELSDLMELGEIGYVAGMSKIITKNLNALDETIRPIHCTDTKRETFYVKDEDKWEKEDVETKKLKKLIFRLSNKTYKLMPKYREMYPDYDSSTSTHSDEYCKIIIEAMMCDPAKDDKIIRNISKITAIAGK